MTMKPLVPFEPGESMVDYFTRAALTIDAAPWRLSFHRPLILAMTEEAEQDARAIKAAVTLEAQLPPAAGGKSRWVPVSGNLLAESYAELLVGVATAFGYELPVQAAGDVADNEPPF